MDTFEYIKALALQIVYKMLAKYPLEQIIKPMPDTVIPHISGTFIYKMGKDPIKLYITQLADQAEEQDALQFADDLLVEMFSNTINSFIPEIKDRIEEAMYNIPSISDEFDYALTKAIIKHLPEREKRKHEAIQTFVNFLNNLDEEQYNHLSDIIRKNVKFYAVKSLPKKKTHKNDTTTENNLFSKKEKPTEKELLKEIGINLQNTNALRIKEFNIYMLQNKKPIYTQDRFFSYITNEITDIANQIPQHQKIIYNLWKKAFIKQMIPFFINWKDDMDGKPPYPEYLRMFKKRKEERFYTNIHKLTHEFLKLKNTFPFTEKEEWLKTYEIAKKEYYDILKDFSELVHIAYILSSITPKWRYIPKMPGWLVNLSNLWKDITRYAKRTQYIPIAKKQAQNISKPIDIPKPVKSKKKTKHKKEKEELTLFNF